MRLFIGILVGILVLFQYDLWFGKNGYFDYKDGIEHARLPGGDFG